MKDEIKTCSRCGRELVTTKSIDQGYGPVCYKKHLKEEAVEEFRRNQMTIEQVGV